MVIGIFLALRRSRVGSILIPRNLQNIHVCVNLALDKYKHLELVWQSKHRPKIWHRRYCWYLWQLFQRHQYEGLHYFQTPPPKIWQIDLEWESSCLSVLSVSLADMLAKTSHLFFYIHWGVTVSASIHPKSKCWEPGTPGIYYWPLLVRESRIKSAKRNPDILG